MSKTRIPREKIIYFNLLYVYFLEGKKVYRARRKSTHARGAKCFNKGLRVQPDSIEEVKCFWNKSGDGCTDKTAKVLKRYGVEIIITGRQKNEQVVL